MPDLFLEIVPYLALVTRIWVGANMMIHGYSKLRNLKQAADEMKQTLGIPIGATYTATILEFFGGLFLIIGLIVPIIGLFFAISMIANVIMKKTRMNAAYIAPGKASYEIDITYLILSIILIVLGAAHYQWIRLLVFGKIYFQSSSLLFKFLIEA
jgi:putative oxidoreductase